MTKQQLFDLFNIADLLDLPAAVMTLLEGDPEKRDETYRQLIVLNNLDLSRDFFQELYESELSQRKQKKQYFTPDSVETLASLLTGLPKGMIHEPTAGNGSLIIADWWNRCLSFYPWTYKPSDHIVSCWELSDRSIPLLLFNLSIRGIMGEVIHGDVLERTVKARYVLINEQDDALAFSMIVRDDNLKQETK
jgi:hypothetical protein